MRLSVVIPVYRDADRARAAALAVMGADLPPEFRLEVVLVDDGSNDGTCERLRDLEPAASVVCLGRNAGRSVARNAGVEAASGEFVIFMDCDCLPASRRFLLDHVSILSDGHVASCGQVTGIDDGFWGRFQADASRARRRRGAQGAAVSGASSNLGVRRAAFLAVGGFDPGYGHYGFEDRDLLLRLAHVGSVAWTPASIKHCDRLTLGQIAAKMAEAGQYSSRRFSSMHPDAYRALGYGAIDARLHRPLAPLARLARPMARLCAGAFDRLGFEYWLPYALARFYVRCVSAAAYLGGTARAT